MSITLVHHGALSGCTMGEPGNIGQQYITLLDMYSSCYPFIMANLLLVYYLRVGYHWVYWWGLPRKGIIAPSGEIFSLLGYRSTWIIFTWLLLECNARLSLLLVGDLTW